MPTTKDKLLFVAAMSRATSATVRQCEALLRYSTTLKQIAEWERCDRALDNTEAYRVKRDRIWHKVAALCRDICERNHNIPNHCVPEFSNSGMLTLRVKSGVTK